MSDVATHLRAINGTPRAAAKLITGYSDIELDELGGLAHCCGVLVETAPGATCGTCGEWILPTVAD